MSSQTAEKQVPTKTLNNEQRKERADYRYVGDDGGRWLFERRSDGLCFTIDKPKDAPLTLKTQPLHVLLTVRGGKEAGTYFSNEVLKIVRT
jgi:hypothetical protein